MNTLYLSSKDETVYKLLGYTPTRKDVAVTVHDAGGMSLTSYWDGGTRDHHTAVNLETMERLPIPENGSGFTAVDRAFGPAGLPVSLPAPGFAVITETKGSYSHLTIHIHRDNAAKLIATPVEISWAEQVVLVATRSLKSSYNGKTRFDMARSETGITKEQWDTAKASLIARKMLNAAGAITTDGKNVAGSKQLYSIKAQGWDSLCERFVAA